MSPIFAPENIERDIEISKHQEIHFLKDMPSRKVYDRLKEFWELNIDAFTASIFYNLGKEHGIREERARRKSKHA